MHDQASLFVSIIVPIYNRCEELNELLESLAMQTYPKERFFLSDIGVYHKRRISLKRFFKQIFNWGVAHINLGRIDKQMLRPDNRPSLREPQRHRRYGTSYVRMDEALVDLSGRSYLVFNASIGPAKIGDFDAELAEEFFRAVAHNGRINLHVDLLRGSNGHRMGLSREDSLL